MAQPARQPNYPPKVKVSANGKASSVPNPNMRIGVPVYKAKPPESVPTLDEVVKGSNRKIIDEDFDFLDDDYEPVRDCKPSHSVKISPMTGNRPVTRRMTRGRSRFRTFITMIANLLPIVLIGLLWLVTSFAMITTIQKWFPLFRFDWWNVLVWAFPVMVTAFEIEIAKELLYDFPRNLFTNIIILFLWLFIVIIEIGISYEPIFAFLNNKSLSLPIIGIIVLSGVLVVLLTLAICWISSFAPEPVFTYFFPVVKECFLTLIKG